MSKDIRVAIAKGASTVMLRVDPLQFELVRIQPGEFTMGSPKSETGHAQNEEPTRNVRISKAFYLGRFQITRAQYRMVMSQPSRTSEDETLPVSDIRYERTQDFCRHLSAAAQLEMRLPTEAQWEFACRARTQTPYYSGSTEADLARAGWYSGDSEGKAHPVGLKEPNAWGLYDMHGNVWEYCGDFIEDYATMAATDPVGRISPRHGAMRGGGWMHDAEQCRSATRLISDDMFGGVGFRISFSAD
jgi:formylglycine-generating enzyme required for sulfatase activity